MAFGMKGWMALAGLLLSGVAVVLVPPGRVNVPEKSEGTEAREVWAQLQSELQKEVWAYQHLQWRDSLVNELTKGVEEGQSVILGTPPETADSLNRRLATAVEDHLQRLDALDVAMPLGVFFMPNTQFLPPGLQATYASPGGSLEYYVARDGEESYCIIGAPYLNEIQEPRPSWSEDPLTRKIRSFTRMTVGDGDGANTLGYCRHFVRYGPPGPEVRRWLQGGAFLFGGGNRDRIRSIYGPGQRRARAPFGAPDFLARGFSVQGLSCLQGVRSACLDIVLNPSPSDRFAVTEGSPVDFHETGGRRGYHFWSLEIHLFSAMERAFGADRFGDFWRSPLEPEAAFREAFGEPMDLWVMKWIRSYLRPTPRGPGVPVQATLLAFLTLGILAGAAVRMARR